VKTLRPDPRRLTTYATLTRTVEEAAALVASGDAECAPCTLRANYEGYTNDAVQRTVAALVSLVAAGDRPAAAWSGPIGFENEATGDGRMIEANALSWDTPVPLMWAPENNGGHQGAQVVGWITDITRDGSAIMGSGAFDLGSEVGREAYRHVQEGLTPGISMDLDDVSFEVRVKAELMGISAEGDMPMPEEPMQPQVDADGRVVVYEAASDDELMVTTSARIRGATLVATPAFAKALISLDTADALVASVTGATDLPVAGRDVAWDGAAAATRVFDFYTDGDTVDTAGVARAFLWRDADADPTTKGAYSLGFADIIDGALRIVPRGVAATAGGRGVDATDIPDADKGRVRSRICTLYAKIRAEFEDWPECPFSGGSNSGASVTASAAVEERDLVAPVLPPQAWFAAPDLDEPTPFTISDTGRVFGHIAVWGTCHIGYAGQCVTPPESSTNYSYFRTGEVMTEEGSLIAVGSITIDTGHAGDKMGALPAISHYDNTGTAVAYVAAGEDAHGIWVSGTLRADATPEQVRALRAAPISGDWRKVGAGMELVAALGVNVPGFPVPRTRALVAGGQMQSLVAAGMLAPRQVIRPGLPGALSEDDLRYLKHLANAERERQRREAPAAPDRLAAAAAMAKRVKVLAFATGLSR